VAQVELMASPPDGKRRLPLAPRTDVADEADEDRPPWHWSGFGAVGVFVLWAPLAFIVNGTLAGAAVDVRWQVATIALNAAAFALASFGAGFLVGRFSGKAGRREATVAGFAAAAVAWAFTVALTVTQGMRANVLTVVTWALILAALTGLGAGAGRAGGALGVRRRRP
jgi:tRNA-(ms[2]io[6]A)-hydroxylase